MVVDAPFLLLEGLPMMEAMVEEAMEGVSEARVGGKHLDHPILLLSFLPFNTNTETENPQNPSKKK
jgi:hypothetical protein